LRVSAVGHRLIIIVLEYYVAELTIRNVLDDVPFYSETTTPLVLLPKIHTFVEINWSCHLSYTTELTTCIDLQKSVGRRSATLNVDRPENINTNYDNG
jgi:hypothetical protein